MAIERVVLVSPRGYCAGVVRAIATVEEALNIFGPPVYVRRAIVHNAHVVARLAAAGARFVDEVDRVPPGSVVVLSAHGVSPVVHDQARARGLRVVDATCPLVAKIHREVRRYHDDGYSVVLVGRGGHDEVVGTLGQAPGVRLVQRVAEVSDLSVPDPERIAVVTQTTLSPQDVMPVVEQLRKRFSALKEPSAPDICPATGNRQTAITWLAHNVDTVLVVGDPASSNSRSLRAVAAVTGTAAHLIGSIADLDGAWLMDARVVGVSAGASTPEGVVRDVVDYLCMQGAIVEERAILEEKVTFALPPELAPYDRGRGGERPNNAPIG